MSFKFNVFKPLLICSTNLLILIISWLLIAGSDAYIHVGKIEYMKRWIKTIKKRGFAYQNIVTRQAEMIT